MSVQRLPSNRDIAKKRSRVPPLSSPVVSPSRPRSPLAPDARSLRHSRLRINAPANSGRHCNPLLRRVAPPFPQFCLTGSCFRKRRAPCMAGPRLLQSCAKSSRHRKDRHRSTPRPLPALSRANAATPRNRKIHCARRRKFRVRSISAHRRIKHCPRFDTTVRFSQTHRFSRQLANTLAKCRHTCPGIQHPNLQFRAHRPRRACLCCAPTQMRHLSCEEILRRKKSANSSGQEISSAHKATHRTARVCGASGQDSA